MTSWRLAASFGVLVGLAGCTAWQAERREDAAEDRYPPDGQIIRFAAEEGAGDGARNGAEAQIHLQVMGEGPDVVLIHGASGSLRDMTFRLAPTLAQNYRVIAVDRPGFGYSTALENDTLANQARLLQAAVAQVGAERPVVLGHSYGGAVALAWALERPQTLSGLVLLSAASQTWEGDLPLLYKLTAPPLGQAVAVPLISAWAPGGAVESAVADAFAPEPVPEAYADWFGPEMTLRRVTMRANARQRAALKAEIAQMVPAYGTIDMPVELVHASGDTIVGAQIHSVPTARAIPGARLTLIERAGHMIQQTRVPEAVAAVDRVFARLRGQ